VLFEQPGPWGYRALGESRLDPVVAGHLRRARRRLGVRVLLIRRPDRPLLPGGPAGRHLFLIHSGPGRPWIRHLALAEPAEIEAVDLEPLGRGAPPDAGEPWPGPLFLVCTNGRRDPCCAERGRPLAGRLAEARPDDTWECTHIGGDRFAATLVAFPHGIYYGRVEPQHGVRIAEAYAAARIDLSAFRGRSCMPFAAQAADAHLRRAHGLDGVDDLRLTGVRDRGARTLEARFASADGRFFAAVVRVSDRAPARPFTCRSAEPASPPAYEVEEIVAGAS
jgi:hypothetical protein